MIGRAARLVAPACALVLALLGSCAYYNIFWTAEREYDKATSGTGYGEFWDPYAQHKPTGDNLKNVESCLKRCGKILLLYPKSKWVDDALVLMGNCFVIKGEYANGLRKYEELLRIYPSSEFVDEAKYMKAYTHVLDGSTEEALSMLESQVGHPRSKEWQERWAFLLARIYDQRDDCDQSIILLGAYLDKFPGGRKATDVSLALGECLIKVGRPNEAIAVLQPLEAREDQSGAMASVRLGRAYRELGRSQEAIEVFDALYGRATVDTLRARAKIEKALTLEGRGEYQEAIDALAVADSLAQGTLGPEARYQTGLIYEKDLGDFAKATEAYDGASKGTSDFSRAAAKRAGALKTVDKHSKALLDSTATAGSLAADRFVLAETYLLDLNMPNLAEEQYRVLSDSLPANVFTARSMLVLGSLLDARGDSTASRYYQAVIDSFPNTVHANIARSWFGLPLVDAVIATEDTARAVAGSAGSIVADSTARDSTVVDSTVTRLPGMEGAPADSLGADVRRVRTRRTHEDLPAEPTPTTGEPSELLRQWEPQPNDTSGGAADTLGAPEDSASTPQSDRGEP